MKKRFVLKALAAATLLSSMAVAQAADTVKFANIVELSGPGTTAGTNFKNGENSPSKRSTRRAVFSVKKSNTPPRTPKPTQVLPKA